MERDDVLDYLTRTIHERLGERVKEIILFGSRARGDAAPDSDYDCLVVVDEVSKDVDELAYELGAEALDRYDALCFVLPVTEESYKEDRYHPLLMNVRREGVAL